MRVLVTRAEPAASRTKLKLDRLGHEPVILSIFELVDTGETLPESAYDGVIFTSANAVEILARRKWSSQSTLDTAYCVGQRTADAAKEIGFSNCVTASGGGAALCEKISNLGLPQDTRFLYPTTPDRSFDMQKYLHDLGHKVDCVDVYQTRKISHSADTMRNAINACKNGAILIYSARSAAHLAELMHFEDKFSEVSTISLICISKSATNILLKYSWRDVYVASDPDEESMLSQLNFISSA